MVRTARGFPALLGWILALAFLAAGCTRSSLPYTILTATPTMEGAGPGATPTPISQGMPGDPSRYSYAVLGIPAGETLALVHPAGIAGSKVGDLPFDHRGVRLTGAATQLGSSLWVEVAEPVGGSWVNIWNLTEDVAATEFCGDPRVMPLLQSFATAVQARDGAGLGSLASPRRGLVIRHDWWNPEVAILPGEVSGLFASESVMDWGESGSGLTVRGTFSEQILPLLEEALTGSPEVTCNRLRAGSSARPVHWPDEYVNLNYYSFHQPSSAPGSPFGWRTLAVGVEYVGGQPYIGVLVLYAGEV